ncbi:PREDICTED: uncharacterized protein LOC109166476 [Ipomoea nil]|uniref:uncharacterized protein LOC109166476 n=1 Tax=Ipomoea nil TaxID=35883 RepID=UPI000900C699|nr:PREDICTED: uncharacterized protein LOC109166476 [Ipomoea nil]
MKVFKWTPDFQPDVESPIVPVWIALLGLSAHLKDKRTIYSIMNLVGSPLKVDASTLAHNRLSVARVCIELNVLNPIPEHIWINRICKITINNGSYGGFAQPVKYEYIPPYCQTCQKFGHLVAECRVGQSLPLVQKQHQDGDFAILSQPKSHVNQNSPLQAITTIVPPRKRWRPLAVQSQEESQNWQQPELETGSTTGQEQLVIPDQGPTLGPVLIDDHFVRSKGSTETQPGHLSDGDEVHNAQAFSKTLLKSWKQASKIFASRISKPTLDEFVTLGALIEDNTAPLLLGGDFNVISSIAEYRGNETPKLNSISDFSTFIADQSLLDLATTGGYYTWSGVRNMGKVWKRLDRFLLTSSFRDYFTDVRIMLLNRTTSDHAPILLCGDKTDFSRPKQFRVQNMWLSHASFLNFMKSNLEILVVGGGMRALAFKLKRIKKALRVWNRDVFGNVLDRVMNLEQSVSDAKREFDELPTPENRELFHPVEVNFLIDFCSDDFDRISPDKLFMFSYDVQTSVIIVGFPNVASFNNTILPPRDQFKRIHAFLVALS